MSDEPISDNNSPETLRETVSTILSNVSKDILERPISREDYLYLLSLYPYVTVCDQANAFIGLDEVPKRMKTKNGWNMYVYQSAICIGTNYFESERFQAEQHLEGIGTLSKQAMDAVVELIEFIRAEKKWETIEIIYGNYSLQRMVWMICVILHSPVSGFDPQIEDEVVRRWLEKIRKRLLYPPELSSGM